MNNYPDGMSRSDLLHVGGEDGCEDCKCEYGGVDGAELVHDEDCDDEACAYCEHGKDLHVDDMVCELVECDCREFDRRNECDCEWCQCGCHEEPNYD